jgi:diguanylate cyclase (GGDEF)-like protein/PAS domain S-box-containing protein
MSDSQSSTLPQDQAPAGAAVAPPEGFALHDGSLVDEESVNAGLLSLLSRYPEAPLAAVREDGIFTAIPESLVVDGHPELKGQSALELVLPQDRAAVIGAWDSVRATRAGRVSVRLVSDPDNAVTFVALDLRSRHGVFVVVFVPADSASRPVVAGGEEIAPAPPRFATVRKDERSFFVDIDDATTQILGWDRDEMVGRRSLEFLHPDDHAIAIENWMEMLAAPGPGRRVRLRHRHRDGTWIWLEITNHNLLDDQAQRCVISQMIDITEEMAAQEALRAREQLLDRLAEAVPIGLLQIDAARQIVYTNDRLHDIVGTASAATVDELLAPVLAGDGAQLEDALAEVLREGVAVDVEIELCLPPDDEERHCTVSFRALTDKDGTVNGAIACVADVTDSTRLHQELRERATFDALTGCHNREALMGALEAEVARSNPDADRALIFIDLDHFKHVNDEFGHAAGDQLLTIVATRLRSTVRDSDTIARIGGDEFLVLSPDIGGEAQAMELAHRVAAALNDDVRLDAATLASQASIGVAWSRETDADADALIAAADRAMYESKRDRRGVPSLARTASAPPAVAATAAASR